MMTISRKLQLAKSYVRSVIRDLDGVPGPNIRPSVSCLSFALFQLTTVVKLLSIGKSYNIKLK